MNLEQLFQSGSGHNITAMQGLLRLVAAACLGVGLTWVNMRNRRHERNTSVPLEQAQILLCVTGALMMIIIGDSLARAFGIAGAAGIIRFRTPVENPRDTILLFLLLGVGMACGLGFFGVAVLGAIFLALLLLGLDHLQKERPRQWVLELGAEGADLPVEHVESILSSHGAKFEARHLSLTPSPTMKYQVSMRWNESLEKLNAQLMNGGSTIRSVAWAPPKRSE